jgi:GT2 family glycosyltransferase
MELSIIAVVIDNLEVTKRFVSSIRQYTKGKYELILIDNGSKNKKAIQYFKKSANKYFRFSKIADLAKAWNKGIEISTGKHIAIVNNDTVVPPDWFKPLKETLNKHQKAGMVSPMTHWLYSSYFTDRNLRNLDIKKPFKLVKFKDIVWGEFCVFKKEVLKKVGGFCELYKRMSAEDLEMCFQLYDKGYDIYVDPRIFIYHEGGASTSKSEIISKKVRDKYYDENFKLFKSRWPKYTKGWK